MVHACANDSRVLSHLALLKRTRTSTQSRQGFFNVAVRHAQELAFFHGIVAPKLNQFWVLQTASLSLLTLFVQVSVYDFPDTTSYLVPGNCSSFRVHSVSIWNGFRPPSNVHHCGSPEPETGLPKQISACPQQSAICIATDLMKDQIAASSRQCDILSHSTTLQWMDETQEPCMWRSFGSTKSSGKFYPSFWRGIKVGTHSMTNGQLCQHTLTSSTSVVYLFSEGRSCGMTLIQSCWLLLVTGIPEVHHTRLQWQQGNWDRRAKEISFLLLLKSVSFFVVLTNVKPPYILENSAVALTWLVYSLSFLSDCYFGSAKVFHHFAFHKCVLPWHSVTMVH